MRMLKFLLMMFFFSALLLGDDLFDIAMRNNEAFPDSLIRYQLRTIHGKDVRIESYDYSADPEWQLINLNGKSPSKEDIETYYTQKKNSRPSTLKEIIIEESVTKIWSEAQVSLYQFEPDLADGLDAKLMLGEITVIDGERPYIRELSIHNKEPFRMRTIVKFEVFSMTMTFWPADENEYILPDSLKMNMDGKVAGVKDIGVNIESTYGNFILDEKLLSFKNNAIFKKKESSREN